MVYKRIFCKLLKKTFLSLNLINTETPGEGHCIRNDWGETEALFSGGGFYLTIPDECSGCTG